jgi:hypothetical protein
LAGLSGRERRDDQHRAVAQLRGKELRRRNDEASAQWTSSSTRTSGCCAGLQLQCFACGVEQPEPRYRRHEVGLGVSADLGQQRRQRLCERTGQRCVLDAE